MKPKTNRSKSCPTSPKAKRSEDHGELMTPGEFGSPGLGGEEEEPVTGSLIPGGDGSKGSSARPGSGLRSQH